MPRYNLDATDTSGTGATALNLSQWISIDQGSVKSQSNRLLMAQYGDGYAQFTPDGINVNTDKWDLIFVPLQDGVPSGTTYYTSLITFYNNVGVTQWFYWTPLGETTPKKWRITKDTYKPTPLSASAWQIAFSVFQCFDN